jgi:hypothetical protein
MISLMGFDADNRGDDAYFVFRRPASAGLFSAPPADTNAPAAQKSTVLPATVKPLSTAACFGSASKGSSASSPSKSSLAAAYHYLSYSDRVEGWTYQTTALAMMELLWLQEEAGLNGNSAEIGVHHGCSTLSIISAARQGETIYAIDIFDRQDLNISGSGQGNLEIFQEHLRHFFPAAHVEVVAKSSFAIRGAEKENGLVDIRFLSVDGDHSKAATLNDLAIANACVAPHGIVCLDDVYNVQWTGVASALFEFLDQKHDLVPFAMFPNKLFLCRAAYTAFYQEKCRKIFDFALDKRKAELMNNFIDVYGERWPHITKRLAAPEVAAAAAFRIDESEKKGLPIKRHFWGRPGDQTGVLDYLIQQAEREIRRREAAESELKALKTAMSEREAIEAELNSEREAIGAELDAFRSSSSWRITAPLRSPLVRRIRALLR